MGLLHSLKFLRDLNLRSLFVEMDCFSVVNDVNNFSSINTELGVTISHCTTTITHCQSYRISYVRRQVNFVVHSHVRASRLYVSSHVHDFSSTCITNIVANEMI